MVLAAFYSKISFFIEIIMNFKNNKFCSYCYITFLKHNFQLKKNRNTYATTLCH